MSIIIYDDEAFQKFLAKIDSACNEFDRSDSDQIVKFNEAINVCTGRIASELIGKNTKYGGAYRKVRQFCKKKYGDARIPYEIHKFEKQLRIDADGDDEDAFFDFIGYGFLEYVCRQVDDAALPYTVSVVSAPVPAEPEQTEPDTAEQPEKKHVVIPRRIRRRTKNGKTCVECGEPLLGKQEKYCGKRCSNISNNKRREGLTAEPESVEGEARRCVICDTMFLTAKDSAEFYCSKTCKSTGRHKQRYGWLK